MSERPGNLEQDAEGLPSAVRELLGRRRLGLFLLLLVIELGIFFFATWVPISAATQQLLQGESKTLSGATNGLGPTALFVFIFSHNVMIALGEMIPVVGGFLWVVSIYATGQLIQAAAISQGYPGAVYGVLILILPFAIVELSAYAAAVTSGVMIIFAWRRHSLKREARVLALEVVVVAAMLLTAAAMEAAAILDPLLGLALWIPAGIAFTAIVLFIRRQWRDDSHGISS